MSTMEGVTAAGDRVKLRATAIPGTNQGTLSAQIVAATDGDAPGRLKVEPLGRPAYSQDITTGATSASITLNAATTRVSIYATKAARFRAGDAGGAVTAVATDHFIGDGERLDFIVPAGSKLAAIQSAAAGVVYVTELA